MYKDRKAAKITRPILNLNKTQTIDEIVEEIDKAERHLRAPEYWYLNILAKRD